ncbi:MAG: DUF3108 domain-containing protein [Candidatus Azobacteroides sp.]|nr:DUF3108 domain-containing protein [Candidatus Azobacteroides sp.]
MRNIIENLTEKLHRTGLILCLLSCSPVLLAQQEKDLPFQSGEQLNYNIYYKYGIMMVKAGTAQYDVKDNTFRGKPAIKTSLTFKTSGVVDKAFKVRDTLIAYSTSALVPVFHRKFLHEGKMNHIEDIDYKKFSTTLTSVQSKKYTPDAVKFDTLLTAKSMGFDMLSIFIFIRTLDYSKLKEGTAFGIASFVGKDVVPLNVRYMGQSIIDKGNTKYKTLRFEVDIVDRAFEEAKTSMEVWISDDNNRIPIKLKAKLKIGAAEAEIASTKNLKHPFASKIEIK